MITDLFVIYVSYLEKVREIVIWSGQWSAVSCCNSESEDEVLIDVSAGLLKNKTKQKLVQVTASDIGGRLVRNDIFVQRWKTF